jgi:hypothetical protein
MLFLFLGPRDKSLDFTELRLRLLFARLFQGGSN